MVSLNIPIKVMHGLLLNYRYDSTERNGAKYKE